MPKSKFDIKKLALKVKKLALQVTELRQLSGGVTITTNMKKPGWAGLMRDFIENTSVLTLVDISRTNDAGLPSYELHKDKNKYGQATPVNLLKNIIKTPFYSFIKESDIPIKNPVGRWATAISAGFFQAINTACYSVLTLADLATRSLGSFLTGALFTNPWRIALDKRQPIGKRVGMGLLGLFLGVPAWLAGQTLLAAANTCSYAKQFIDGICSGCSCLIGKLASKISGNKSVSDKFPKGISCLKTIGKNFLYLIPSAIVVAIALTVPGGQVAPAIAAKLGPVIAGKLSLAHASFAKVIAHASVKGGGTLAGLTKVMLVSFAGVAQQFANGVTGFATSCCKELVNQFEIWRKTYNLAKAAKVTKPQVKILAPKTSTKEKPSIKENTCRIQNRLAEAPHKPCKQELENTQTKLKNSLLVLEKMKASYSQTIGEITQLLKQSPDNKKLLKLERDTQDQITIVIGKIQETDSKLLKLDQDIAEFEDKSISGSKISKAAFSLTKKSSKNSHAYLPTASSHSEESESEKSEDEDEGEGKKVSASRH